MAKFSFNGVDYLSAKFEELAQLDDEDKLSIIRPAAQLLLQRQKEKILSTFEQWTGALAESLAIEERSDDDGVFARILPKGKHPGSSTGKRRKKKAANKQARRKSGNYSGTNAEIAYILEYGSPRIFARHWLEYANNEAEDDLAAAEQAAWDDLLTRKGL